MSILKKLVEFIRTKLGTFVAKNVTVEDQYTEAANAIIERIHQLKTRHVTSNTEKRRLEKLAEEKDALAESKEKEIKRLLREGQNVDTHAKLGLLYRRTAVALRKKTVELDEMKAQIETTVVALDDQRKDLAVKLEYIRETRNANSLGLDTGMDIVDAAELTKVDVENILMKVDTFNGQTVGLDTTGADIEEYLASLK